MGCRSSKEMGAKSTRDVKQEGFERESLVEETSSLPSIHDEDIEIDPNNDEYVIVNTLTMEPKLSEITSTTQGIEYRLSSSDCGAIKRCLRRRVPATEREFIWKSTNGLCYLCKTYLPPYSSWHIEHILAFSKDPAAHDVLGNMLPACSTCNLRKNNRSLEECIKIDKTFDLATWSATITHLSNEAKIAIVRALDIKHESSKPIDESSLEEIIKKLESTTLDECNKCDKLFTPMSSKHHITRSQVSYNPLGPSISNGSFGKVYKGQLTLLNDSSKRIDVAIKLPMFIREDVIITVIRELDILSQIHHENIVKYYGWFEESSVEATSHSEQFNGSIAIVMELCVDSLDSQRVAGHINPNKILLEVIGALTYLHSQKCVHRDVKPHNILLKKRDEQPWSEAQAKLCDFGSAKFVLGEQTKHTYTAGSTEYRSPEVRKGLCVPESDVFSLGKTISYIRQFNRSLEKDQDMNAVWEELAIQATKQNIQQRIKLEDMEVAIRQIDKKDTLKQLKAKKIPSPAKLPSQPVTVIKSTEGEVSTVKVFLAESARSSVNRKGTTRMKYHGSAECGHLKKSKGIHQCVSLDEARQFEHTPCSSCAQTP